MKQDPENQRFKHKSFVFQLKFLHAPKTTGIWSFGKEDAVYKQKIKYLTTCMMLFGNTCQSGSNKKKFTEILVQLNFT